MNDFLKGDSKFVLDLVIESLNANDFHYKGHDDEADDWYDEMVDYAERGQWQSLQDDILKKI